MRRLTAIVAVNEDGVIGVHNRLPWRVKSDLQFFKRQTVGNILIMGRRTFESIGKCLPDRDTIVITREVAAFPGTKGCGAAGGVVEALAKADREKLKQQEVFVVGGESIYRQFAPFVDRYLITEVQKPVPEGDAFFDPDNIGDLSNWSFKVVLEGKANDAGDEADFRIFELNAKDPDLFRVKRAEAVEAYFARARSRSDPHSSTSNLLAPSM